MENLNAEQIKYCLEFILKSGIGMSRDDVDVTDIKRALALINSQEQRIKELTEKNEGLRAENEIKTQKRANIFEIANAFERGRTVGVRRMQERIKQYIDVGHYRSPTEICFSELDVANIIDRIAKEMLEVAQRPEVLNDQSSGLSDPEGDRAERRTE